MDLLWYRRYRADDGEDGFGDWEFSAGTDSFDDAGAPGQVGKKLAGFAGVVIPDRLAGMTNNVVHWATGISWGTAGGVLAATTGLPAVPAGALAGVLAFSASYIALPALGVYKQIWEYDAATLWKDASAHLVFGSATGVALAGLRRLAGTARR